MSNDESAMAAGSSIRFKTCVGAALSSLALLGHTTWSASTAGCPSGQWKRTVNPSAYAFAGSNPAPATIVRQGLDLQLDVHRHSPGRAVRGRTGSGDVNAETTAASAAEMPSPWRCTTFHCPSSRRKTVVARSTYGLGSPRLIDAVVCSNATMYARSPDASAARISFW